MVDITALAQSVVTDLRASQPERAVTVNVESGLTVRGDGHLLRIVLVNLIGNAWKYSSRRPDARIEVGRLAGQDPTFFVRDNGAGFDMAYAQHLFAPFQRLHSAQEFDGTGVGLATVQRIVSRHGGRIWADATIGAGAVFFFTVPGPALSRLP
jgi:light-regulated signal transduction histidine kinase (bacteriophytochrome)